MTEQRPRHRFYCDTSLAAGAAVTLHGDISEQIRKVLRLRAGDQVGLFDGQGSEALARITGIGRDQVDLEVISEPQAGRTGGRPEIHLGVALLKADRFEMVIQKATELGVASITPLETQRSVVSLPADRARSRLERWRRIAVEALEQSGRSDWVAVREPVRFPDAIDAPDAELRLIAWEDEKVWTVEQVVEGDPASVLVLIGPEGGFTPDEADLAREAGFQSVSLGALILRSETAAIASVAMIRALAGLRQAGGTPQDED